MVNIYKKYFKAIFLDWIDAKKSLKNLSKNDQRPSFVKDDYGNKIQVIWTNSASFQKFQRFIFSEIDYDNYLNYIKVKNHQNFYVFTLMIVRYLILDRKDFLLKYLILKMNGGKFFYFTKNKISKKDKILFSIIFLKL